MFKRHEGFFEGQDGTNLFFQTWETPNPRGTVVITHGQGEHSECYQNLVEFFTGKSWNFWAWDLRGHGRSEGKRGYAPDFSEYLADARVFYRLALSDERLQGRPVVGLSHSMGGLIQLNLLLDPAPPKLTAQVCSSPLLGLSFDPPAWKKKAAELLNKVYPEMTLWNEIKHGQLTRDPEMIRSFEQDVLRHDRISPGVYLGFEPAWSRVLASASKITLPTLFLLPEEDPVVSTPAAQTVFAQLGSTDKELKTYGDGARHEMFNDLHRQVVYADLEKFLNRFLEVRA